MYRLKIERYCSIFENPEKEKDSVRFEPVIYLLVIYFATKVPDVLIVPFDPCRDYDPMVYHDDT